MEMGWARNPAWRLCAAAIPDADRLCAAAGQAGDIHASDHRNCGGSNGGVGLRDAGGLSGAAGLRRECRARHRVGRDTLMLYAQMANDEV